MLPVVSRLQIWVRSPSDLPPETGVSNLEFTTKNAEAVPELFVFGGAQIGLKLVFPLKIHFA